MTIGEQISVPREPPQTVDIESLYDTFRIGTLNEANRSVVSVPPQTTLREALSTMLLHHVSNLPVMRNERAVTGVLRWKDIGKYLLLANGTLDIHVDKIASLPREVEANEPFLKVIPDIIQHGCILVRGKDRTISGIVTKKDLGRLLQEQASPFVMLGEIERCLRAIIERGEFTVEELKTLARDPADPRPVSSVADLTLGEYQRLLERSEAWDRVRLTIDKRAFLERLSAVRRVRNDVTHFDPDSPTEDDLKVLRQFLELVYELRRYAEFD